MGNETQGQGHYNRKIQPKLGGKEGFPQKAIFKDKDGSKRVQRSYSRKVHDTCEQETKRRSVLLEHSKQEERW